MKKLLVICPYFAPNNAADMHRVRTSVSYFEELGWQAEIVAVDPNQSDMVKEPLFLKSIPSNIKIHHVEAFSKKWTVKFGLGSLGLRSIWFYKRFVDRYIPYFKPDLIYFSTTEFPVCVLGAYWKRKFRIPYVIDMQDPWHSTYYLNKKASEQPPKYWFTYRLHKYLEPIAMKKVSGIVSVSKSYIDILRNRYPEIAQIPTRTITFGASRVDIQVAEENATQFILPFKKVDGNINLVYIGRGGADMHSAVTLLFKALKLLILEDRERYDVLKFIFIGTSYAPEGRQKKTIEPVAKALGIEEQVVEYPGRISYYQSINTLMNSDALIVPGSDDPNYTASKIFPYILVNKPLLAIFHANSSVCEIIEKSNAGTVCKLNDEKGVNIIVEFLRNIVVSQVPPETIWQELEQYSARVMAKRQCELFDEVLREEAENNA